MFSVIGNGKEQAKNGDLCGSFSLHHDCLLDAMTYLSYDSLMQDFVASCFAICLALEEFVYPRLQSLISMLDEGECAKKIISNAKNRLKLSIWAESGPLLESVDNFSKRVVQEEQEMVAVVERMLIAIEGLSNLSAKSCLETVLVESIKKTG